MAEPSGKPVPSGPSRSNADDARWALTKARRYVFRGGAWTPTLHAYVDRWLDFLRSTDREAAPGRSLPLSEGRDREE